MQRQMEREIALEREKTLHLARAEDAEAEKHAEKAAAAQVELSETLAREKGMTDTVLGVVGMSPEQRLEREIHYREEHAVKHALEAERLREEAQNME